MQVGYARVSTSKQDERAQVDALKGAGCEKVFRERVSAGSKDRPQLHAALDYLRPGDVLVVAALDRLARSMRELIGTVEALRESKIQFRSLRESLDTTTPQGVLTFHLFASLAQFERELIRQRTAEGLAAAKRAGRIGGRRPSMSAADVQAARALMEGGFTGSEVATRMRVSRATLYRHLAKHPAVEAAHA